LDSKDTVTAKPNENEAETLAGTFNVQPLPAPEAKHAKDARHRHREAKDATTLPEIQAPPIPLSKEAEEEAKQAMEANEEGKQAKEDAKEAKEDGTALVLSELQAPPIAKEAKKQAKEAKEEAKQPKDAKEAKQAKDGKDATAILLPDLQAPPIPAPKDAK
jgi:hypothetical protein